jgi:hypothetical protein
LKRDLSVLTSAFLLAASAFAGRAIADEVPVVRVVPNMPSAESKPSDEKRAAIEKITLLSRTLPAGEPFSAGTRAKIALQPTPATAYATAFPSSIVLDDTGQADIKTETITLHAEEAAGGQPPYKATRLQRGISEPALACNIARHFGS